MSPMDKRTCPLLGEVTTRVMEIPLLRQSGPDFSFAVWPVSDMAHATFEVRSVWHIGPDLLTLSSSHFEPDQTSMGSSQT